MAFLLDNLRRNLVQSKAMRERKELRQVCFYLSDITISIGDIGRPCDYIHRKSNKKSSWDSR